MRLGATSLTHCRVAMQALDEAFGIDANANTVVLVASVLEAVALIGAVVGGEAPCGHSPMPPRVGAQLAQIPVSAVLLHTSLCPMFSLLL